MTMDNMLDVKIDWELEYTQLYTRIAIMLKQLDNNTALVEWDKIRAKLPLPTKV